MPKKTISKTAEGKHIGHACEGHLRGIFRRAIAGKPLRLVRDLPFDFHVNPDVVVLDDKDRVNTVVIVAFWNNADNSHMKYYRSRSEYNGVRTAITSSAAHFAKDPITAVILYGAPGGWKDLILRDLETQCAPCFYLPDTFSEKEAAELVDIAYSSYKPHWESGKSGAREHVESVTSSKPTLASVESKLLILIRQLLNRKLVMASKPSNAVAARSTAVRLPAAPIATRYRQPLGFLSLFPETEISAWKSSTRSVLNSPALSDYAIRAHFLGLGTVVERKVIGRSVVVFQPALAIRTVNGKAAYAPDLMDFKNWEEIPDSIRSDLLDAHRALTRNPGSVFEGGSFDQCIGNVQAVCHEIVSAIPRLITALEAADSSEVGNILKTAGAVRPEAWHPAVGKSQFFPVWSLAASAVACARNDRALRSDFDARTQTPPTAEAAAKLARELFRSPNVVILLNETVKFCQAIQSRDLKVIAATKIPDLMSSDNPSSLLKDFYNTLTTNSSHNPLNSPVRDWLTTKFPGYTWHGWPARRTVAPSKLLNKGQGRRQWQFVALESEKRLIVCAEVKSITANHWGDKSKELYDRVAETRGIANEAGYSLKCVGIFDGDVGREEFQELETGIGYDEVYSIKEILGI